MLTLNTATSAVPLVIIGINSDLNFGFSARSWHSAYHIFSEEDDIIWSENISDIQNLFLSSGKGLQSFTA